MVLPYPKGLIVIKKILHIVLVYLLWCFCVQSLVLNRIDPLSVERWPWKAWDVTLDDHDVIQPIRHLGRQIGQYQHVWHDGGAQGGLTFCSRMLHLP
jgi:hypothetical protein